MELLPISIIDPKRFEAVWHEDEGTEKKNEKDEKRKMKTKLSGLITHSSGLFETDNEPGVLIGIENIWQDA